MWFWKYSFTSDKCQFRFSHIRIKRDPPVRVRILQQKQESHKSTGRGCGQHRWETLQISHISSLYANRNILFFPQLSRHFVDKCVLWVVQPRVQCNVAHCSLILAGRTIVSRDTLVSQTAIFNFFNCWCQRNKKCQTLHLKFCFPVEFCKHTHENLCKVSGRHTHLSSL